MTSRRPRIGVVLPAFRVSSLIAETLEALAAQTVAPAAAIVVVDGRDPETESAARRHPSGVEVDVLDRHTGGPGGPRNHGARVLLDRGSVDAVWFLDPDDVPDPRFVELTTDLLARFPDASMVTTGFRTWRDGEARPPADPVLDRAPATLDRGWYVAHTGDLLPSFTVIRCAAWAGLRASGDPYDPSLRSNQDYDAHVRLLSLAPGVRSAWSGGAYRLRGDAISADGVKAWLSRLQADEGLVRWFLDRGESELAAEFRAKAGSSLRRSVRNLWRRNRRGDRLAACRLLADDLRERRDLRSLLLAATLPVGLDPGMRRIARTPEG